MINFFRKKEIKKKINQKNKLPDIFPWITNLEENYIKLSNQDINLRIKEIGNLKNYFNTSKGIKQLLDLKNSLVKSGYPKNAAQLEIDFFLELFDDITIQSLLFNAAAGLHLHLENGKFKQKIKINKEFGLIRTSIGKVFIVGSSNTLLPVLTSMILSYIAGNNTVVQLSSLHANCIPNFIGNLPFEGANHIHFTNLYREKEEDLLLIETLITNLKWDVINIWGGNNSLDFYNKIISKNTHRPRIINMEPLTGALIIQQDYFEKKLDINIKNLSYSIRVMGQQLCSSPTIGFLINYKLNESIDNIFENLIKDIEKNYIPSSSGESNSIKLDRMINIARDKGSRVYVSSKYSNNICVIISEIQSAFNEYDSSYLLNIHERRNFIEIVCVENFSDIYQILNNLFKNYSYKDTKKIQTLLSFGDPNFDSEVHQLASLIGAYRIIDSNFVLRRHPMEYFDNYNLFSEFTNSISVVGSKVENL